MLKIIDGSCFRDMIKYGINQLEKNCDEVNNLNVFPVPDGDTGTNMLMTIKNGFNAIQNDNDDLGQVAKTFANATVFGARGNSGVIVSQFFKGMSIGFKGIYDADTVRFSRALDIGCEYAYASVVTPVEGTILTIIKDSADAVRNNLNEIKNIDELISVFLKQARITLENTPNLLAILAKAGVVDSGGAGLIYFFEGIERYLNGETIELVQSTNTGSKYIDFSVFNKNSNFEYGYCTEALLQLTIDEDKFDQKDFTNKLQVLGESIVVSLEGDKVKVHIHTHTPENVLAFCHQFGEFLTLKIENMTIQHTQTVQKYLCTPSTGNNNFAVVAVAPNNSLQKMLSDMGADVVILSAEVPTSQDFIKAFEHVEAKDILVFPNNANSILSAMQAGSLYKKSKITVLNCRSIAECYSAMAVIDFSEDISTVVDAVDETIGNMYEVSIVRCAKNTKFGNRTLVKNDYFAMASDDILRTDDKFENIVNLTVKDVLSKRDCNIINLFYGQNISLEQIEKNAFEMERTYDIEVCLIPTQDIVYDLVLSFE